MARPVTVKTFQQMQTGESEALSASEREDVLSGKLTASPSAVRRAEAGWTEKESNSLAVNILEAGPREYDVTPDGTVRDWRRPETTPDAGSDAAEKYHTIGDASTSPGSHPGASRSHENPEGDSTDFQQSSLFLAPENAAFSAKLYRRAPELLDIAHDLIETCSELSELVNCEIRCYWRRTSAKRNGRRVIGATKRAGDLLDFELGCDFVIWISAEAAREALLSEQQIQAAIYHQLARIGTDDNGNFISVLPDFSAFSGEIARFGSWRDDLKVAARTFRSAAQAGLFDTLDDEIEDEAEEDPGTGEAWSGGYPMADAEPVV